MTRGDVLSIRVNLSMAADLLAIIMSWLTPYPWWLDLSIVLVLLVLTVITVDAEQERGI